ncbi:hypothetical protein [Myxosarcina sp. GI1]|uniref:hypothetical protein n=1 Tax=Myxosarcina sp. GI1 TaxID=1541065 RepID=UPI000564067F|nr:hypothetical protein [Myxosarcina sp. GI1]
MNINKITTSACRFCRYYKPVGRRGGSCQMLGVPVQSSWKACALATPPFETDFLQLEELLDLETSLLEIDSLTSSKQATVATKL